MSTDPAGLTGVIKFIKYINVSFSPEDWCSFKGECKVGNTLAGPEKLCLMCQYRKVLNVPEILEERNGSS